MSLYEKVSYMVVGASIMAFAVVALKSNLEKIAEVDSSTYQAKSVTETKGDKDAHDD